MSGYTQGTIIYGLRSQYYEEICCHGVIITARCDIEQEKVKALHVLSAISLHDWVCVELFDRAFHAYLENDILGPIKQWSKENGLDFDTLLTFGPKKTLVNINADTSLKVKVRNKLEASVSQWEKWNQLCHGCSIDKRIKLLNGDLSSKKKALLNELLLGRFPNDFYFLPGSACDPKREYFDGLVVNLRDIIQISMQEINEIQKCEIDYASLSKTETGRERIQDLSKKFFLNCDDDFVDIIGNIDSPWIEHLAQNFSNTFARIGVDTLPKSKLADFSDKYQVS